MATANETQHDAKGVPVSIPEIKKKTITMVGSVALLINNCTGGSMVVLPSVFQQAGWVLPFLALVGVAFLSCMCGIMVIEAMTLVPGNNRFQKRLEYTNIAAIYFPKWLYWIAQIFYQLSILAQNVAMIVQSVQVMDFTLVALTGYSCAIPQFSPNFAFTCSYPGGYTLDGNSPFGDWYLISLGWLVTCVMVMPLGFIDLDDNDAVQKGGFFAVIAIMIVWCALAINQPAGLIYVTHFGGKYDDLMGTVLFNFAVVYTLPSWANEKRPSVSIVVALAISTGGSVLIFLALGYFGGAGFPPPNNNQTLLNQIYGLGTKISAVTFYLFPACVNLTSIPVNSIMQRYNLKESGVCGSKQAAFWGVVAPWLIAIPLYTGNGYQTLVTWAGLVLVSSVNFIFPPILYLLAIRRYGTGPHAIRTLLEEAQLTGNTRHNSFRRNRSKVSDSNGIAGLEMIDPESKFHAQRTGTVKSVGRSSTGHSSNATGETSAAATAAAESQGLKPEAGSAASEPQQSSNRWQPVNSSHGQPTEPVAETTVVSSFQPVQDEMSNTVAAAPPPVDGLVDLASANLNKPQRFKLRFTSPRSVADGDARGSLISEVDASKIEIDAQASKVAAVIFSGRSSIAAVHTTATVEGEHKENHDLDATTAPNDDGDAETEEELEESRQEGLRRAEKEEARRQRTLKKLRKLREKAAALTANPVEVAKEHEEILPLDLSPPPLIQPLRLLAWILSLPWHAAFYITIPHSATSARLPPSKFWPLTLLMVIGWGVLISVFIVWSSAVMTEATGFHAFPFGIFVVGFLMRTPNLITEYNSFKNEMGDLNRIFSNSVWQILICLPLPWLVYGIVNNGSPFTVHSGAQSIVSLTMFLLSALMLILFKSYDWYMLRPVAVAAASIIVLFFLMVFLLDYSIIMDLSSKDPCDVSRPITAADVFR